MASFSTLAALVASGQWLEITSDSNIGAITDTTGPSGASPATAWTDADSSIPRTHFNWPGKLCWDEARQRVISTSASNGYTSEVPAGAHSALVKLSAADCNFSRVWNPTASQYSHVFDGNPSLVVANRYWRRDFDNNLWSMDCTTDTWTAAPGWTGGGFGGQAPALDVHPNMGAQGSVILCGYNGRLVKYDIAAQTTTLIQATTANVGTGTIETVAFYSSALDAVVFGGGLAANGDGYLYKIDAAGAISLVSNTLPSGVAGISPNGSSGSQVLLPDPNGTAHAWLFDELNTRKAWRLDLNAGTWSDQGAFPTTFAVERWACGVAIPSLGVHVWVDADFPASATVSNSRLWMFRPTVALTITRQPSNSNTIVGSAATFSVSAIGETPTYQWQDDSSGSFADIAGATSASYTTAATTSLFQRRQYRCVVSAGVESINSQAATLTLNQQEVFLYAKPDDTDPNDVRLRDPTLASGGGAGSLLIAQVVETDTAQPFTAALQRVIGQVVETGIAQPLTASLRRALGQVTETDTAQPFATVQQRAIGQVVETDAAQPLTVGGTAVVIGQVVETDTAQPLTAVQQRAIGQVTETDSAQALQLRLAAPLGQVVETDTAQALTATLRRGIGQVTETDSAQPLSITLRSGIGQAAETDAAQPLTLPNGIVIGQATETNSAQPLSLTLRRALGQVLETDTAQPLTRADRKTIGQVTETDSAQPLAVLTPQSLGLVLEIDTATPLGAINAAGVFTADGTTRVGARTLNDTAERIGPSRLSTPGRRIGTTPATGGSRRIG